MKGFTESGKGKIGRNIHFGIREHAMGSIQNGMAYYGGVIPYSATFLAFLDYMKTIREVVADLSLKMREGKVIRNDSLEKVRKLHDWSRDMNIFGYKPLEEELAKLKAGLDGVDIKATLEKTSRQL